MKIGIITTHYGLNYGAVLQAFSLEKYLYNQNCEVEIMDFQPHTSKYGRNYYVWTKNIKQLAQNVIKALRFDKKIKFLKKRKAFDSFIANNLILGNCRFKTIEEYNADSDYDVLICGSDQIWNLNLFDMPEFFLPFKDYYPNAKFISYAASVAENLSESQWKEILDRTKHFDAISFRENEATDIFLSLGGKADTVVDPVFLLSASEWNSYLSTTRFIKKPYVLCYFIGYRGFEDKLLRKIKQFTGFPIINVGMDPTSHLCSAIDKSEIEPFEFVRAIRDAEFVITNSFHMTAFSIIFRKNFFVVKHTRRNSRMNNLLDIFGIENRMIDSLEDIKIVYENKQIYNAIVNQKIDRNIDNAKKYLNTLFENNA